MNSEETKLVNKTSRNGGVVGSNAILPRYIINHPWMHGTRMLDFGSGKNCVQTNMLRDIKGFNVDPYDIGDNFIDGTHHVMDEFTFQQFGLVFASNVVNVQPNEKCLREALHGMKYFMSKKGIVIFNYPSSPRKIKDLTKDKLLKHAMEVFESVLVENYNGHTIFTCMNKPEEDYLCDNCLNIVDKITLVDDVQYCDKCLKVKEILK